MPTHIPSGFTIKRPLSSSSGFATGVDPIIATVLDDLNNLLGKRVFLDVADGKAAGTADYSHKVPATKDPKVNDNGGIRVATILSKNTLLTPKRVPACPPDLPAWDVHSVAGILAAQKLDDKKDWITLAQFIDKTADLVNLKYEFQDKQSKAMFSNDFNTRAVLESYPNIADYLVAYAFEVLHLNDVDALNRFIHTNDNGARSVVNYAVISAARTLIEDEQLSVTGVNDDDGGLVKALRSSAIPLSAAFKASAKAVINNFVFNSDEIELIDAFARKAGPIPEEIKLLLVEHIKSSAKSGIPITQNNVEFYLPGFITQSMKSRGRLIDPEDSAPDMQDQDFNVQFRENDDASVSDISRSAIHCAAQLYHGMVVGDELDVFGVINYFTHKYLIRGGLEIRDKRLRSDLRMYVFSDRFVDFQSNKIMDRTRPPERQMFFRQVFNEGTAEVTEDVIVNPDFKRLWNVMVLESAKFLQRSQTSYNSDIVSRQNVMQAVEDLQYNLSTNCTGMVNVIAPLIDAELNFVLTRILKHPEVVQHVVPSGGTWQRVVETLSSAMKRTRPRATTLYSKARLGEGIIRSIAEYTPSSFNTEGPQTAFSKFISQVDAFITTQSILQESLTSDIVDADGKEGYGTEGAAEYPGDGGQPLRSPGTKAAAGGAGASDEWDF